MKDIFTHIVITRFNIQNDDWHVDKKGCKVRTDQWMEDRINLFEKICFPSLLNQTVNNFKWLIYVDVETKQKYRDYLEKLLVSHPRFYLKYVGGMVEFRKNMNKHIKPFISNESSYLITTRIDNDDAFHHSYLASIQRSFNGQELLAINFPIGLQWSFGDKRLFEVHNDSNPFITLIEKIKCGKDFLTVFHREHRQYLEKGDFPIKQVLSNHLWLQVIHETNVLNRIVGREIAQNNLIEPFNLKIK